MRKVEKEKKCNIELVLQEKSATCKMCNTTKFQYGRMQHEKRADWK